MLKPNTVAFENKAREIIAREFKTILAVLGEDVKSSVYLPENDTGRWAPESLLIVNHEHGIAGPMDYEADESAKWERITFALTSALGRPVFFEPINQAVSALYWA